MKVPSWKAAVCVAICAAACGSEIRDLSQTEQDVAAAPTAVAPRQTQLVTSRTVKFSGRSASAAGTRIAVAVLDARLGAQVCKADVATDRSFSCSMRLAEGGYTWTARVDPDGASSAPIDFVVATDNLPAPLIDHTPALTNDRSPVLTGTIGSSAAECGLRLEVRDNGQVICAIARLTSTDWSCQPSKPLADGPHLVIARLDDGEDASPYSNPNAFVVKTGIAPPGIAAVPSPTGNNRPTLSGSGEAGAVVTVSEKGAPVCRATVSPSGKWSCGPADPLADGTHAISVVQEDGAGNASTAATATFAIDTHVPGAPTLDAPATPTSDARVRLSGTGEAGNTLSVIDAYGRFICTATVAANKSWSCAPANGFDDGDYLLSAFQVTAVGNRSGPSAAKPLSVRTLERPLFDVLRSPTRDIAPLLGGSAQPGRTIRVVLGESSICTAAVDASGRWTCRPQQALADGSYLFLAQSSDGRGHYSGPSEARALTVDTTPPGAPLLDRPKSPTRKHQPVLSGTAEAGASVVVLRATDHAAVCAATAAASGAFQCTPAPALGTGTFQFTAKATDAAGNASPEAQQVSVIVSDTTPPAPSIEYPLDGADVEESRPTITGRTAAGTTVTVTFDGAAFLAQVEPDGRWKLVPPVSLAIGEHDLTVVATDAELNVSDDAASRFFRVPAGVVRGGCTSAGASLPVLAILAFLAFRPRRSRRATAGIAVVLLCGASVARAQDVDVSLFRPASGGDGLAATEGARPPIDGDRPLELRTWTDFAVRPLVFVSETGGNDVIVRSRSVEWLGVQAHLIGPLSIAAQVPLTMANRGDLSSLPPSSRGPSTLLAGFGDLRLTPRLALLRQEWAGIDLAAQMSLEMPTARAQSLTSDGRLRAEALVSLGRRLGQAANGTFDLLANVYTRLRPQRELLDVRTGNEAGLRAGLAYLPDARRAFLPRRVYAEAEGRSFLRSGFSAGSAPAEWRLGAGFCPAHDLAFDFAGGTALTDGVGAPRARFLVGFGWSPTACGSDVPSVSQLAQMRPPPQPAPSPATPPAGAPAVAPEPPRVAVASPLPPPDRDGDGIPDSDDNCPDQAGPVENHGCARGVKQLVVVGPARIEILEQVRFATGKAVMDRSSYNLLDQVAAVILSHPDLRVVQVEGHTDDRGNGLRNLVLSRARAEAVAAYLENRGVPSGRLRAKGFGDTKPIDTNRTAAGRAANRRVAFNVVQTGSRVIEAERPES